ncbi:MAG TPA: TIR domain-containing protein, partial [Myxococcota bacterium]|nr:TIR domain-containing protein [Myxococcota bacterium]
VEEEPPATPSEPLQPVVEEPAVGEDRPGRAGVAADSAGDLGDLDDLTLESAEIPKPAPVQMPAPVRPQGTAVLSPHPVKPVGTAPEHFGVADPFAAPGALPTQISCLHPHLCQPEAPFLLEVVLHLPAAAPSPSRPGEKVERALGNVQLPAGVQLRVEVRPPPGFSVDSPDSTLSWLPPSSRVGFLLTADKEVREGSHIIPVLLYPADGSVAFCRVYATVEVGKVGSAVTDTGHRPTVQIPQKIFASYASKDRAEVLERVASLKALGIDVFVDCLDIAEGQRWEEGIQRQICSRDALLLFWSRAAAASRWVEQEWKLALAERGLDYIFPNALEAPSLCPPPPPLAALQFGSTLAAVR